MYSVRLQKKLRSAIMRPLVLTRRDFLRGCVAVTSGFILLPKPIPDPSRHRPIRFRIINGWILRSDDPVTGDGDDI